MRERAHFDPLVDNDRATERRSCAIWTATQHRVFEYTDDGHYVPFHLVQLTAFGVDEFISKRRGEGVSDSTIHKELSTLRQALRLAKRSGLFRGDLDELMPMGFSPGYRPKERFLSMDELRLLLGALPEERAARVAFIVATSARWSESVAALRSDVAPDQRFVALRGTKTAGSARHVPIVTDPQRSLLDYALAYADHSASAAARK